MVHQPLGSGCATPQDNKMKASQSRRTNRESQLTHEPGAAPPPPNQRVKVLLVDDEPRNLLALEALLHSADLDLIKANSGREALRCLLKDDFALILMDVRMPAMDGLETAELIRQRERSQRTPIIFLTAFEPDDLQVFKGYSVGAVDYLHKPIVPEVLRSKVAVFIDIYRKTEEVKRQAELLRELERRQHEREMADARARWEAERIQRELLIAKEIQQRLFPPASVPLPGFDISGASYPAEATGGDYFDYIPMADGSLSIVIADVSGHGFGPALLMAETRAYLRAFMLARTDVGEILTLMNRALAADVEDRFATLLLGRLDPRACSFVYTSAGHPTGYVLDPSGAVRTRLRSTGLPLAVRPDSSYEAAAPIILASGELVLLLTDGVLEAHPPDKEEEIFGLDRTLEVVRAHQNKPAREIVDRLYEAVRAFCGPRVQFDDLTVLVLKVMSGC
jgi:serine phosphatase RsbU (regulator of sigma subunit)